MQYQLQYDKEGNASLKTIDATPTRKISEGTFEVSKYFALRIDYGITETYADKFSPEKQLEDIQKKLLNQDSGNGDKDGSDYKKDLSPAFDWKTYTYNTLVAALGEDVANDYLKYSKIEDYAKIANWAALIFPVNYIAKGVIKGAGKFATSKKEDITKQYLNFDYYTKRMKAMDQDYKDYGDYDVYSDIEYGPSYGKEITEGTIYDAEDHGEPPNGIMSKPEPISVPVPVHISGGNNGGNVSRGRDTSQADADKAGGFAYSSFF